MTNDKRFNIAHALHSLAPGATWKYNDEDFSTIEWLSDNIEQPTLEAIEAEINRLNNEYKKKLDENLAAEEATKEAKKSALAKLAKLGLTEEEAKAVIGL